MRQLQQRKALLVALGVAMVVALASTAATAAPAAGRETTAAAATAVPNHKKPPPPPSGESPSETPAAPPPDPVVAPAGTTSSVQTSEEKKTARVERNAAAEVMAVSCALAAFAESLTDADQLLLWVYTGIYFREMCAEAITYTLALNKLVHDPPDPNFAQVVLTQPQAPTFVGTPCPKGLAPRGCLRLKAGLVNYGKAVATTTAALSGLVTSIERFAGAVGAGSLDGQLLQAGAAKAYAAELSGALSAQQVAGRALASILRAAHHEVRLSARARQLVVTRLSRAALPASILSKLNPADVSTLGPTLAEALAAVPRTLSLAAAVSTPVETTALTDLHKTLTVYEVATLVRGLTTQGAVSAPASETLLNDLRQSVTATAPEAHAAALAQFQTDAKGQVTGPAGALVIAAGQGLS